jgi:putative oxidoreductase
VTTFLKPYEARIYAALRIVAGLLFACHGAQKVFGVFGGPHPDLPIAMVWAAGLIELVGGALVAIGLQTRWAAFVCSGQMAVAYFMVHQARGLFPIENGGEPAALYSFVFLLIAVRGAGTWSIDGSR